MKPFRPPTLLKRPSSSQLQPSTEPHAKKRRLSDESEPAQPKPSQKLPPSTFQAPWRKPLHEVTNRDSTHTEPSLSQPVSADKESSNAFHYNVLWRKKTTKKNKTWDGDGVLSVSNGVAVLKDVSKREIGRTAYRGPLLPGSELSISGKDVEVDSLISNEDYAAEKAFVAAKSKPYKLDRSIKPAPSQFKKPSMVAAQNPPSAAPPSAHPPSQLTQSFKPPTLDSTVQVQKKAAPKPVPRHDPSAENALVMKTPSKAPPGKQLVDVVVDPILTARLRQHQREGVAFLYECVMGLKDYGGEGAILADEMGLGKTLQTIALLWTLLKQNPVYGESPVVKKALIVCPVSLIKNWRKEFIKWLSRDKLGIFLLEGHNKLTDFTRGKAYSVMIIGYEKFAKIHTDLQQAGIDIVIADEGHRLKTSQSKAVQAIKAMNTERRIILSGTPLQNDLSEFWTMTDLCNPGLLNKYASFKKDFENPIIKARQPGATKEDIEKGEQCSEELANITKKFILRRTADETTAKYLPPKTEYVLLCRPTKPQVDAYRFLVGSSIFKEALGKAAMGLALITALKKVCNSPSLLLTNSDKGEDNVKSEIIECIPPELMKLPSGAKLLVLDALLHQINTTTDEKVVIVSHYTSTLDVIERLVISLGYKFLRLDGKVTASKRQELVDRFNRSPASKSFVFLLSAKAGGVGLNLIGASRLVLFDLDWNPAIDLQAMARIHRDGQKKPCYIYRMLIQGGIDEKIFQRQISKTGLADSVVDGKKAVSGFAPEELREIFTLDERRHCQTHEILLCQCGGTGVAATGIEEDREVKGEEEIETLYMKESDDGSVRGNDFIPGSQYDERKEEIQRKAKECRDSNGKAKMLSLMRYTHFDTSLIGPQPDNDSDDDEDPEPDSLDIAIDDKALQAVLRRENHRVGFIFTKSSR